LFVTSDVKHKFFITQSKGINDILKWFSFRFFKI
jgi:hypothetical protein